MFQTETQKQCPRCKMTVRLCISETQLVWPRHGKYVLGSGKGFQPCAKSLVPVLKRRTK